MERIAVCPGSFDPVTKGHEDIIRRAAALFDRVLVVVSVNADKKPAFSVEERAQMIRTVCADIPNVEIDTCGGLLVDYVQEKGAVAIVKGLRAVSDFDYEFQMALVNRKLCDSVETIFLASQSGNMFLSSSIVRQIASYGGDISEFVSPLLLDQLVARFKGVQ